MKGVLSSALGFALLAALLVANVSGRIGVVHEGLVLSRLQARQEALARENARLRLEVLTLRAPARLERLAQNQLGLAPPAPADILREAGPRRGRVDLAPPAALAERP